MAESKISLETKLRITGITVAKGVKAANIKASIDTAHFKQQIEKAQKQLSQAVEKLKLKPQVTISQSAIASIKKQIRDGIKGLDVGKLKVGVKGQTTPGSGKELARAGRAAATLADNLKRVNQGMRTLVRRLESVNQMRGRGPGGGPGGGAGRGGGSGPFRSGGAPSSSPDPRTLDLARAFNAPLLETQINKLTETIQRDLFIALTKTGKEAEMARERIRAMTGAQQQLQTILGQRPKSAQVTLATASLKSMQEAARKATMRMRELESATSSMRKGGVKAGNAVTRKLKELEVEAARVSKVLGRQVGTGQLIEMISGQFGGGKGQQIDFGTFFGKGGAFDQFKNVNQVLIQGQTEANKFGRLIEEVGRKAAVFRIAAIAINTTVNAVKTGAQFLVDFESSLRDINMILRLTDEGFDNLSRTIAQLSAATGVAAIDIAKITEEFARAGLAGRGFGNIMELTERAVMGMQGAQLSAAEATQFMVQIIGQLESGAKGLDQELISTSKGFDILGRAADITAAQATDVIGAFKRSGASLLATGATFEEVATLITVTQERTQRGAEVIGTAFKTIATRISNPASEAARALRSIGVEVVDAQGNLRNIFDVLQDTSRAFSRLTEAQQANIASTVAGVRQVEIFRQVVGSAARQVEVLNDVQGASGDAARKQAEEQRKIANIISRIRGNFDQLINTLRAGGLDEIFRFALTGAEQLLKFTNLLASAFGKVGSAVAALGIGKILGVALGVALKLKKGFLEFLQTIPAAGRAAQNTMMVLNNAVIANAEALGASRQQVAALRMEYERLRGAATGIPAPTVAPGGPGGVAGVAGVGGKKGRLGFLSGLDKGLLGAAVAVQTLSLATSQLESKTVDATLSVASLATNGALLGSVIPGVGTAIGGLIGALVGIGNQFIFAEDATETSMSNIRAAFERTGQTAEGVDFDTFIAGVERTAQSLVDATRKLEAFGEKNKAKVIEEMTKEVEALTRQGGLFLELNAAEQLAKLQEAVGKGLGEALNTGPIDLTKVVDLPEEQLKQIEPLLLGLLESMAGLSSEEVQRKVEEIDRSITKEARDLRSLANQQIDTYLKALADMVATPFGETSRELLEAQAAEIESAGSRIRRINEALLQLAAQPRAQAVDEEIERKLALGAKAARFELESIFTKDLFDLRGVMNATEPLDELATAFNELGQFSDFANAFRRGSIDFIDASTDLQDALIKAHIPARELARAEAELARSELERLQVTTRLQRDAGQITLFDEFRQQLLELGEEGEAFQGFAENVINSVRDISVTAAKDPVSALQQLQDAASSFSEQVKQIDNEAIVKATETLFDEAINLFIKTETEIANKRASLNKALVNALKEQISNTNEFIQSQLKAIEVEELRASILTDQLSSIDKLIAEEMTLVQFTEMRTARLQEELAALRELDAQDLTVDQREELNKAIEEKEREFTKIVLDAEKKRNDIRRQALDESIKLNRQEADFLKTVADGRRRLVELLGEEERGLDKFTSAVNANFEDFRIDMVNLGAAIDMTANSTLPAMEKERRLAELRQEVAKRTLDAATAEAEIIRERQEAIQELAAQGLQVQDELGQAQQQVMEATRAVSEAFNNYADATQAVIAATSNYVVNLRLAGVEATRLTGGFAGIREEITAVTRIFRKAEQAALAVGAGEKIIADLRKRSIEEQIRLFTDMLETQKQQARSFFTASREEQASLFRSIQTVRSLVESGLFGNSFQEFQKKGESAINEIGARLLALPQATRQGIVQAIQTLGDLGVQVGGFTAEQLQSILDTTVLGTSEELEVDPLFEVQGRIADLIEEQSRLQLDAIISANEQVNTAKEQLSVARNQKDLAEIQLDRLRENADMIGGKIVDMRDNLKAPILQQTGVIDSGFKMLNNTLTGLVTRLESFTLAAPTGGQPIELPFGARGVQSRANQIRQSIEEGSRNEAALSFATSSATLPLASTTSQLGRASQGSNLISEATQQAANELLRRIETAVNSRLETTNTLLTEINDREATAATTTTAPATPAALAAEFNITVEGQQQVRVTGLTEGINTAVQNIINTFGPFVTETVVREQIIQPILDRINAFFIERGLPVLEFQ